MPAMTVNGAPGLNVVEAEARLSSLTVVDGGDVAGVENVLKGQREGGLLEFPEIGLGIGQVEVKDAVAGDALGILDIGVTAVHVAEQGRGREAFVGCGDPRLEHPQRHVGNLLALHRKQGIGIGRQILGEREAVVGTGTKKRQPWSGVPGPLRARRRWTRPRRRFARR